MKKQNVPGGQMKPSGSWPERWLLSLSYPAWVHSFVLPITLSFPAGS
jgi:hypothetical protein